MKVLFLDIDGVLNSHVFFQKNESKITAGGVGPSHEQWAQEAFDPEAVLRLNKVLEATGAKVVISSSWRIVWTVDEIRKFMENRGFKGEIIGRTPSFSGERGHEISFWLNSRDGIEKFAIVDDSGDMAHLMEHLVQTSWGEGMLDEHAEELIKRLT